MKKNVVQDVVPPKKSIRNVTLSSRPNTFVRKPEEKPIMSRYAEEDADFSRPVPIKQEAPLVISQVPPAQKPPQDIPSYKYEYDEPKRPSKKWWYASLCLLVLVLAFGVSAFFKSAVIRVTPKQESQAVQETFKATKDATGNVLGFQVVSVSKELQKTVAATGQAQVDKKASGRIVIYNNTPQIQKLVATTRFQTPEGLVFRLPTAVSVPAQTVSGGKTTPGSLEVTVEADKTGTSYNIGLKDFTLPGLKGDPKYTTVYARSKTEMTGGFSGIQKVVAPDVLAKTDTELAASLKTSLATDISTQIPANFILYPDSLAYTYSSTEQISSTDAGAVMQKKGTVTAVIFDKTLLTKAILDKVAPTLTSDTVRITDLDSLVFAYAAGNFDPNNDTTLNFSLTGNSSLVYIFDENKLKSDLLGLSRDKARTMLSTYDSIKEAWVETHPFWNQTIPKDPKKVTIVNTLTP